MFPLTLALTTLCENPRRRTGLSTLWPEWVRAARRLYPHVHWLVFAPPESAAAYASEGVELVTSLPANDRRQARLWADHWRVGPLARQRGASALITVGFVPWRSAGLPVAMQVLSLHHRSGRSPRAWYRRAALTHGLRRARRVICNSAWTGAQLAAAGDRLVVSPEGVATERFTAYGASGYGELPPGYFLWASNFYPYKRAELALAAYARLPVEMRARRPFVLAGGDWAGGRARAEQVAHRLGLGNDVRFLGWVPDEALPALYRGAGAFVLSSAEETFGRSVLEAMACGCVTVLQDLPVLREVTGGAAFWTDFSKTDLAARALEAAVTEGAVAAVRSAGLARAANFSFERLARERTEAVLAML